MSTSSPETDVLFFVRLPTVDAQAQIARIFLTPDAWRLRTPTRVPEKPLELVIGTKVTRHPVNAEAAACEKRLRDLACKLTGDD